MPKKKFVLFKKMKRKSKTKQTDIKQEKKNSNLPLVIIILIFLLLFIPACLSKISVATTIEYTDKKFIVIDGSGNKYYTDDVFYFNNDNSVKFESDNNIIIINGNYSIIQKNN